MSLNNLGGRLSELGRHEDALVASREARDLFRRLAADRADAFLPDLAMSLCNLGNPLSELGRCEEALAAAREATDIYRHLAADRRNAFLPHLAMSLNNLGNSLSELGRREDALAAAREAVTLFAPVFLRLPEAHAGWMVIMRRRYIDLSEGAGVEPDAALLAPIAEALQKLESPERSEA
jgi:tetratricopeptide (TPR) repeat protein